MGTAGSVARQDKMGPSPFRLVHLYQQEVILSYLCIRDAACSAAAVCKDWARMVAKPSFAGYCHEIRRLHCNCPWDMLRPLEAILQDSALCRAHDYKTYLFNLERHLVMHPTPGKLDRVPFSNEVRSDRTARNPAVVLQVENRLGFPVTWWWKDWTSREVKYPVWYDPSDRRHAHPSLPPNCTHIQHTYRGHPWYVRDERDGTFLGGFIAHENSTVLLHPWAFGRGAEFIGGGNQPQHSPMMDQQTHARTWTAAIPP